MHDPWFRIPGISHKLISADSFFKYPFGLVSPSFGESNELFGLFSKKGGCLTSIPVYMFFYYPQPPWTTTHFSVGHHTAPGTQTDDPLSDKEGQTTLSFIPLTTGKWSINTLWVNEYPLFFKIPACNFTGLHWRTGVKFWLSLYYLPTPL